MRERPSGHIANGQAPASDPMVDAYKRHIDRTLLRQNLQPTVTHRVENLMALQRLAAEAGDAAVAGRDVQGGGAITGVEERAGGGAVRKRSLRDQVPADDVERIESECLRDAVHEAFEREVHLWRAESSRYCARTECPSKP